MNKSWEFDALLYKTREGFFVDFPLDGKKEFGTRGSVRVHAWFDGYYYRTSFAPKGDGTHWVHVRKEIRDAIFKTDGDTIHVKIERDFDSRDNPISDDLLWLLENEPELKTIFDGLSPSHKKYLIGAVITAKTEETRIQNINRIFDILERRKRGESINGLPSIQNLL
jgi:hypothetical protein